MTAPHDLDRQLQAFLTGGPTELPDPSFDAVRDRIEATHQRVAIGPWRLPNMNKFLPIGLGAAAVVVALVIGSQQFGPTSGSVVGGAPSVAPSATPSPTPEPSGASPSPTPKGLLPEGPHILTDGTLLDGMPTLPITVTISAPHWYGDSGEGVLSKNSNVNAPDGAGMIIFFDDLYVYGDPCRWSTTRPDAPATTVDELVAALAAQASRDATAPVDISLGGYAGKSITLHVPDDAVFSECDRGTFGSWGVPSSDLSPFRYHQSPGQIDIAWALDVDGVLAVIDWSYYAGTPQSVIDELRTIVESITFE